MGTSGGSSAITQPTLILPYHPMNNLPITDSDYSSFTVSQVVQKLGYSEEEVNSAKAELEMKGAKFPTPEEIANTVLDMQERSEHFPTANPASPEIESDSSLNLSQVVINLGYSEVEVNTAKAELEMKGTKFPASEEIVNTLLDIQERSEHFPTATVPPTSKENRSENEQYKKRLTRCTSKLVEKMSPELLLDQLYGSGFLTFVETRDIQETPLTSEKNRAILRKVVMKGKRGYIEFKDCLRQCNQGHLADLLERDEN
ncbi:uncharacterized protein LOC128545893 [Mercenaria mercenaria]|uniref:uncharacterized protein LOC128545893 n=1 Tax=Mercenaria mercenaria TaxID=6596 RepID=UPI001E1D6E9D|nr:uncharacterized protein LOC128545893 [Mercenaria mercenaria]